MPRQRVSEIRIQVGSVEVYLPLDTPPDYCGSRTFCTSVWIMASTNGRGTRPRNAQEARELTWEQFTWLMQGLEIEQPKAIKPGKPKALV